MSCTAGSSAPISNAGVTDEGDRYGGKGERITVDLWSMDGSFDEALVTWDTAPPGGYQKLSSRTYNPEIPGGIEVVFSFNRAFVQAVKSALESNDKTVRFYARASSRAQARYYHDEATNAQWRPKLIVQYQLLDKNDGPSN